MKTTPHRRLLTVLIVSALTVCALLSSCAPVQKCPQAYRHKPSKPAAKSYNYYKPTAGR